MARIKNAESDTNNKTLGRGFDILELILEKRKPLSLVEISNAAGFPASTTHRLLNTLELRNYLKRDEETKKYFFGTKLLQLGSLAQETFEPQLKRIVYPYMLELSKMFGDHIGLFILDRGQRVCIERIESNKELRKVIPIGESASLEKGASGKVMLAFSSDEYVRNYLGEKYPEFEQNLKDIKLEGYALSEGERIENLASIAVPLLDYDHKLKGVLAITGSVDKLMDKFLNDKIEFLKKFSIEISRKI